MRPRTVLASLMSVTLVCASSALWAATNEIVDVEARQEDNPQDHGYDIEGYFQEDPTGDKDEIHVINDNVKATEELPNTGVYNDPVNDGAQLTVVQDSGPVKVDVEGRESIGAIYWVTVTPTGGPGGDPVTWWADVSTQSEPGALVLRDKNNGWGKEDQTDTDDDTPILHVGTMPDGNADVDFFLWTTSGVYPWAIKQGDTVIASSFLMGPGYADEKLDLPAGKYVLEVTKWEDADFKRTIELTFVTLGSVAFTGSTHDGIPLDGIPMKDHYMDKNGNNLEDTDELWEDNDISDAPEWLGDDVEFGTPDWLTDGRDSDEDPQRNKHALVAKGTKFKVKAVFVLRSDLPVKAWATCTDQNLALASEANPLTLQEVYDDLWEGTFEIATAPTAIGLLQDFTWTWHVKIGDQVGDNQQNISTHTVFVCNKAFTGDFAGEKPYDWVAWLSCAWAAGAATPVTDATIARALGDKACTDAATAQVISGVNLDYEGLGGDSTVLLLRAEEGNCFAFANLLRDMGRVQSIDITWHSVHGPTNFKVITPLNKYDMWSTDEKDRDGDNGPGWSGLYANEWVFTVHAYCTYGTRVYDPSMGRTANGTWSDYFKSLMTRYIDLANPMPNPIPSIVPPPNPAAGSVTVYHAENKTAEYPTDEHAVY